MISDKKAYRFSYCVCVLWHKFIFTPSVEEMDQTPTPEPSPELTKRSWFGSLMSTEKDETYTIIVKGKPLASIKADLIHAFLSVSSKFLLLKTFHSSAEIKHS